MWSDWFFRDPSNNQIRHCPKITDRKTAWQTYTNIYAVASQQKDVQTNKLAILMIKSYPYLYEHHKKIVSGILNENVNTVFMDEKMVEY